MRKHAPARLAVALMTAVVSFTVPSLRAADRISRIEFFEPPLRWLWGGFGYHNAEASMTAMMTFLTTDYVDRAPSAVRGLRLDGGVLSWEPSADAEHCYYRVFRKGGQIASTVATKFARGLESAASVDEFAVLSVDRWGNVRDR